MMHICVHRVAGFRPVCPLRLVLDHRCGCPERCCRACKMGGDMPFNYGLRPVQGPGSRQAMRPPITGHYRAIRMSTDVRPV